MNQKNIIRLSEVRLRKHAERLHCQIIVVDDLHRETTEVPPTAFDVQTFIDVFSCNVTVIVLGVPLYGGDMR